MESFLCPSPTSFSSHINDDFPKRTELVREKRKSFLREDGNSIRAQPHHKHTHTHETRKGADGEKEAENFWFWLNRRAARMLCDLHHSQLLLPCWLSFDRLDGLTRIRRAKTFQFFWKSTCRRFVSSSLLSQQTPFMIYFCHLLDSINSMKTSSTVMNRSFMTINGNER